MKEKQFSEGCTHSLSEEIENILRERILKGEYGIGERIKENQVAKELKVSRTPIREAFKQLEKEGLMETIPNRGSFAFGFTKQDIQDIYAVRAAVEVLAMEWAVSRISDKEIKALQETFDLMEFYTRKKGNKKMVELNRAFHEIIYNATGSRFLSQILKSYQDYVDQTRKVTVYYDKNLDLILKEHKEILEALKERNQEKALEKISVHLNNSKARAERGIISK
ncbi:MAG: GntR family transcriptional regulator [Tepidanaerobacteraceae bacterium]|nr:GntR family transcriptional regulator [Tepidanaerobacteraceae bacterium]